MVPCYKLLRGNFSVNFFWFVPCCFPHAGCYTNMQTTLYTSGYKVPDLNIHGGIWNSSYSKFWCIDITDKERSYGSYFANVRSSGWFFLVWCLYCTDSIEFPGHHLCFQGCCFTDGVHIQFMHSLLNLVSQIWSYAWFLFPNHGESTWFVCCPISPQIACVLGG